MSRLKRQVGIRNAQVRLPQSESIGPAMINFSSSVAETAFKKQAEKREEEAAIAAGSMNFQRDGDGMLLPPALNVDEAGLVVPNIYSRKFAEMATSRYAQQVEVDMTAHLNSLAATNQRDPDSYKELSEAYLQKVMEVAPERLRGAVYTAGQRIMVGHFNRIVNETSAWRKKELADGHAEFINHETNELMGLASSGAPEEEIAMQLIKVGASIGEGVDLYYNQAEADVASYGIQKRLSMAFLAGSVSDIPNTQLGNVQAMDIYSKFMAGEGELETIVDGKRTSVAIDELYPDPAERKELGSRAMKFFSDRESVRSLNERAAFHAQSVEWNRTFFKDLLNAVTRGKSFDPSPYAQTFEQAVRAGNVELAGQIAQTLQLNYQNEIKEMDFSGSAERVQNNLNAISETILKDMPQEQLDVVERYLSETIPGSTLEMVINGEVPDGQSNEIFMRYDTELRDAISVARTTAPTKATGGTRLDRLFMSQANKMRNDLDQWRAEFISTQGVETYEEIPLDVRESWEDSLDSRRRKFNLPQGPEAAEKAVQWYRDIAEYEVDWDEDKRNFLKAHISGVMSMVGIIDQNAIDYINGTLSRIDNVGSGEVVRALDFYKLMRDQPNLRNKLDTAFGSVNTTAMDFMLKHFTPEQMKDSAQVQGVMDRAIDGKKGLYAPYNLMTQNNPDAVTTIYERFDAALNTLNDGGWFGADGAGIPWQMRDQLYSSVPGFAHRIGEDPTEDELLRYAGMAIDSLVESSGWAWSEYGLNADRAASFGDMIGPDELLRGWGDFSNGLARQPNNGFSLYPPEKFYLPEDMPAIGAEFQRVLNTFENGLRAGKNAFLVYNGSVSNLRGERTWEIHVAETDGEPRKLTKDTNYIGEPVYITFDHIKSAEEEARRFQAEVMNEVNKARLHKIRTTDTPLKRFAE